MGIVSARCFFIILLLLTPRRLFFISSLASRKKILTQSTYNATHQGLGYGMLLSVAFNDQTTFDGLWGCVVQSSDSNGLPKYFKIFQLRDAT